jgi:hypothetical protein
MTLSTTYVRIPFQSENPKERNQSQDASVHGRILLVDLKETGCEGGNRTHPFQDKYQWLAVLNMMRNLWVLQ